ncbi:ATP-dependent helicase [Eubacterium ventriosum]|uniref:DNA 3'-5' helicase n=1 Tax=Eubacterium ventriosum TaxID=39496 RepID=A0A413R8J9_9FIRM|nr:ATP-dependent helicase [Eubacterium ventriosum]RHA18625.1 ATP-dependent helicase [Eubacterium ventriosum]RHB17531.1 ATP-dependent helicase [Eubacterium ventriosum]RHF87812.1 ATP-dependent helicase [Eubacterium ventriosum]
MFNKSQIQAISHMDGPAMVLAGPGSGKTTVITHRIKNLIEKAEVRPENILVVTFTKAAAISMQKRFSTLMNGGKGQPVTFGTFHSVFYKILRKSRRYEATDILSERQKTDYIREIIGRYGISSNDISELSQNIINDIGNIKGNMLNAQEYEPSCCKKEDFIKVYNAYNLELKRDGKMDFDDILRECYLLLCENHTILEQWRELYKYILIDEFQDINRIQMNIIELLASPLNNIFVVGDDDQSIYGFRGARPEIMIEFKDYYPEAELIVLDVNYRSTQSIINVAGRVIENNKTRLDKCAHANNDKDFQPDIRKFRNQVEELKFVVSKIKEYENQGISLSEMAILVRNNSQIQEISSFLKNRKIEAESGKHRSNIYNGMVAKDILSYVRGALKFDGTYFNEDLIYVLNKPQRYISRQVVLSVNMNISAVRRIYSKNNIDSFLFHIEMIRKLPPQAALSYIRKGAGYEEYLRLYAIENNIPMSGLLKQLEQLVQECSKFNTLEQWINSIDSAQNSEGQNFGKKSSGEGGTNNRINIMTMHGSKGLEFKAVFIVDANQGIIPTSKALRERDFEEERRLFYVAITRAIDYLNVYAVEERLGCPIEVSMFVEEML